MSRRTGTAAVLLLGLALIGCDGSSGSPAVEPGADAASGPAAAPSSPAFRGRLPVAVQAGMVVVNDEACEVEPHRVCSVDGSTTYVAVDDPSGASLVAAGTRPADGHTSWTAVVTFAPGARRALAATADRAAAMGGVVLVLDAARRVLLAAGSPHVQGARIVLENLDKPTAWEIVDRFGG